MQLLIQNTLPHVLPRSLARQALMDVFSRHSLVLTNVPGPDESCVLAGKTVSSVQFFFTNLISQVDLLSYAGQVFGNIVYDPMALPNFHTFGLLYANALLLLADRLGVQPPTVLTEMMENKQNCSPDK
jgi:WS/DGAT C-terminal domain